MCREPLLHRSAAAISSEPVAALTPLPPNTTAATTLALAAALAALAAATGGLPKSLADAVCGLGALCPIRNADVGGEVPQHLAVGVVPGDVAALRAGEASLTINWFLRSARERHWTRGGKRPGSLLAAQEAHAEALPRGEAEACAALDQPLGPDHSIPRRLLAEALRGATRERCRRGKRPVASSAPPAAVPPFFSRPVTLLVVAIQSPTGTGRRCTRCGEM